MLVFLSCLGDWFLFPVGGTKMVALAECPSRFWPCPATARQSMRRAGLGFFNRAVLSVGRRCRSYGGRQGRVLDFWPQRPTASQRGFSQPTDLFSATFAQRSTPADPRCLAVFVTVCMCVEAKRGVGHAPPLSPQCAASAGPSLLWQRGLSIDKQKKAAFHACWPL